MRRRMPKIPNFFAIRNKQQEETIVPHSEQPTSSQPATSAAPTSTTKQTKRSSDKDRNRRSPSHYGFDNLSSDSTIAAPPNVKAGRENVANYQPTPESIVKTVQHIAEQ